MADRKNWSKKDWEEQARHTEADLQRMQAELADANSQLARAVAADPDSEESHRFPFHMLSAMIKQAIQDAHAGAVDQMAQAIAQIQLPAPQVTVQQPAQQQPQPAAAGGGAFKYKHMQDVKLLDVDSMTAADFKFFICIQTKTCEYGKVKCYIYKFDFQFTMVSVHKMNEW